MGARVQGLALLARLAEAASRRRPGASTDPLAGAGWLARTRTEGAPHLQKQEEECHRQQQRAVGAAGVHQTAATASPAASAGSTAGWRRAFSSSSSVGVGAIATTPTATATARRAGGGGSLLFLRQWQWQQEQRQHPYHQHLRGAKAAAKGGGAKKGGAATKKGASSSSAKKKAVRLASKPFDEKHPLNQRLVAMLLPPRPTVAAAAAAAAPASSSSAEEAEAREREYARQRRREFNTWRGALAEKLALKKAALRALPDALRVEALREDLAPFPLARNALFDAPPSAYTEEEEGGEEKKKGEEGKTKGERRRVG